jgi:hypothetical protein
MLAACTRANRAELEVEPPQLDLGAMNQGEMRSFRLLVKSVGGAPVRLEEIYPSDQAFVVDGVVGVELAPGGLHELVVHFNATRPGAIQARVTVQSSAGAIAVPITGTVDGAGKPDGGTDGGTDAGPDGGPDGGDLPDGGGDDGGNPDAIPCAPTFAPPEIVGMTEDPVFYEHTAAIAGDGRGTWIIAMPSDDDLDGQIGFEDDMFFSRSDDDGANWTQPAPISFDLASTDEQANDQRPELAYASGTWVVVWQSDVNNTDMTAELYASRSFDGQTWSVPWNLATERDDSLPAVASDGVVWISAWHGHDMLNAAQGDIGFSRSTDLGMTWSEGARLNNDPPAHVSWDGLVSLASAGPDRFVAVWSSSDPGPNEHIDFAVTEDGGLTWSDPQPINSIDPGVSGEYSPSIASDGNGHVVTAWRLADAAESLIVATSSVGGAGWTAPSLVGIGAADDSDFRVAYDGAGTFMIAWHAHVNFDGSGTEGDILGIVSLDNGRTWTSPSPINSTASSDGADDYLPFIAGAGGQWWVVFQNDTPGGTILGVRGVCE